MTSNITIDDNILKYLNRSFELYENYLSIHIDPMNYPKISLPDESIVEIAKMIQLEEHHEADVKMFKQTVEKK